MSEDDLKVMAAAIFLGAIFACGVFVPPDRPIKCVGHQTRTGSTQWVSTYGFGFECTPTQQEVDSYLRSLRNNGCVVDEPTGECR